MRKDAEDITVAVSKSRAKIVQMTASLGYLANILVVYSFAYLALRIADLMGMEDRYKKMQENKEDHPETHEKFHFLYKECNYYVFVLAVSVTAATCYLKYSLY